MSIEVDWLNLEVGRKFYNRAGAVVEITERRDTGCPQFTRDWKPDGTTKLIICRTTNGSGQYAVFENGNYHPSFPNQLDLIREVPNETGKFGEAKSA